MDALQTYQSEGRVAGGVEDIALSVVDAVLPRITKTKQLLGVPEGSLLVAPDGRPYYLEGMQLVGVRSLQQMGPGFVEAYGPLTVVAMP